MKRTIAVMLVAGLISSFSAVYADTGFANEVEVALKAKGLTTENKEQIMLSFKAMTAKGVPEEKAKEVIKAGIENGYQAKEMSQVTEKLCLMVQEGSGNEIGEIVKTALQNRLKEKDMEKLMLAVKEALNKDASAKQLRIMTQELLSAKCDGECLALAVRSCGELVDKGASPSEAKKQVSLVVMEAVKTGAKGDVLMAKIQDRLKVQEQLKDGEGNMERLVVRERTGMPEEVKDRIKTPDAGTKPAETGTGTLGTGTDNTGKGRK